MKTIVILQVATNNIEKKKKQLETILFEKIQNARKGSMNFSSEILWYAINLEKRATFVFRSNHVFCFFKKNTGHVEDTQQIEAAAGTQSQCDHNHS